MGRQRPFHPEWAKDRPGTLNCNIHMDPKASAPDGGTGWPGIQEDLLRADRAARRVRRDFDYSLRLVHAKSGFSVIVSDSHQGNWFHVRWFLNQIPQRTVSLNSEWDEEYMAFRLVDELWEDVVEYIASAVTNMAALWPQCPRHPHALTLDFDETTEWRCRDDKLIYAPVGSLEYLK